MLYYFIKITQFNIETSHLSSPTDNTPGVGLVLERGEPQVADLDAAGGAGDEDVVALEVAVDDGRGAGVQEVEALEDLVAPPPQHLQVNFAQSSKVPQRERMLVRFSVTTGII